MYQARIVVTRFDGGGKEMSNDIYVIDPDGKNETRLTTNPGANGEYTDNAALRYNRDRYMIAFVSTTSLLPDGQPRTHEKGMLFYDDSGVK